MRPLLALVMAVAAFAGVSAERAATLAAPAPAADPVVLMQTPKGNIEIQFFQAEAPKSVEHLLALARRGFYRGQRIHRVESTLVQFGDPASRDVSRKDWWGRSGSGNFIGAAEFNKRTHTRGAVALAHTGDPKTADSQLYIVKAPMPSLNGKHVVVGQVLKGMDVVDKLQVADVIRGFALRP